MQIALFYFFLLTTIFLQSITAVEINNPWNVYLKGGVFLWQINTTAPSYALLIENNNIQSSEVLPSPKWRSGIKMGIGKNDFLTPATSFDIQWSHIVGLSTCHKKIKNNSSFLKLLNWQLFSTDISSFPESFLYSTASEFQQSSKEDLNLLELSFYNQNICLQKINFYSFYSLCFIWLEILQQMHANDIFLHMPSSNFYINKAYKINKNKIWGMGPKTGFHSKYNFYSNASFLFNLSTALLLTSHKESFKTTTYNIFNISTLTTSLNSKKQLLIQPLFNLALGVNYMTLFDKDNSKIDFNLLYETNFLFYKNYNIYSYGATFSVLLSF